MEEQVRSSLVSVPHLDDATSAGVKCSAEGCVLFLSAKSLADGFGMDHFNGAAEFNRWLGSFPWEDELVANSRKLGAPSPFAWQIVGSDETPYIAWYIVRRKN
jgi:hypothetical protein